MDHSTCRRCGEATNPTRHHIYPRRHGFNGKRQHADVILCRDPCHDDIERIIQEREMEWFGADQWTDDLKMPPIAYLRIALHFVCAH